MKKLVADSGERAKRAKRDKDDEDKAPRCSKQFPMLSSLNKGAENGQVA